MARVLVIGGGIAGLSSAYWAHKAGHEVHIVERSDRWGGCIESRQYNVPNGSIVAEWGAATIRNSGATAQLLAELGLNNRIMPSSKAVQKIWYTDERQQLYPLEPKNILRKTLGRLTSMRTIAADLARRSSSDQADAVAWVRDFLGDEAALASRVFIAGTFGARTQLPHPAYAFGELYTRANQSGSLIRSAIARKKAASQDHADTPTVSSLRLTGGNQALIDALVNQCTSDCTMHLHLGIDTLQRRGHKWHIPGDESGFDAVISTVAAHSFDQQTLSLGPMQKQSRFYTHYALLDDRYKLPAFAQKSFGIIMLHDSPVVSVQFVHAFAPERIVSNHHNYGLLTINATQPLDASALRNELTPYIGSDAHIVDLIQPREAALPCPGTDWPDQHALMQQLAQHNCQFAGSCYAGLGVRNAIDSASKAVAQIS